MKDEANGGGFLAPLVIQIMDGAPRKKGRDPYDEDGADEEPKPPKVYRKGQKYDKKVSEPPEFGDDDCT